MAFLEGNKSDTTSTADESAPDQSSIDIHKIVSGKQTERYFDFFGLPCELRDRVYEQALVDVRLDTKLVLGRELFRLSVCGTTKLELSMINHQFSSEYQTVSKKHAYVFLEDLGGEYTSFWGGEIDFLLKRVPKLELVLDMTIDASTDKEDVDYHIQWITQLMSAQSLLQQFNITAGLYRINHEQTSEQYIETRLQEITTLSQLNMLEVYYPEDSPDLLDPLKDRSIMRYRWTSKDRVLKKLSGPKSLPEREVGGAKLSNT